MNNKTKKFAREIEALRELIQETATPLLKKDKGERVSRSAADLEYFAKTYFPHYITKPGSQLHGYLYEKLQEMILRAVDTGIGDKECDAAPRGHAKSTVATLILPIWCIAYKYRKFVLIVSETSAQSEDFISFVKTELESNERLRQDFPEMCDEGPKWRATDIITRNGCRIRGLGAGQKVGRGMRFGAARPDLVIGDDLENDENVISPDQRAKMDRWFFRVLMKVGKQYTCYVVIGTLIHYDSLLANLLKKPGWKGKKFRAVIRWSDANGLWEAWEAIFTDIRVDKEIAEKNADAFFAQHREEMLAGTAVLWEEEEDYYYLMKMRVSEGPSHFDSEKQNEPINPDDCLFQEEWFQYWDDTDISGYPLYAAIDPSLGGKSKHHDPSAILGGRYKDGIIWLEYADIERRHPDRIIDDTLAIHERDHIQECGVETVQFQSFFKDTLEKIAHEKGITLNVSEIRQSKNKRLRIESLQPWIKNGWIRFKPTMGVLIDQLKKYPMADHDDGPDALEMLKCIIEEGTQEIFVG